MILSWKTLAYQWIIAEVFYSDEEFVNPTCNYCITLVCVACVFDRHRFGNKKLVPQNDGLRNVNCQYLILRHPRVFVFRETTTCIYGIEELI